MEENPFREEISSSLSENLNQIKLSFGESDDLIIKNARVAGIKIAFVMCEGMCSSLDFSSGVLLPMIEKLKGEAFSPEELFKKLTEEIILLPDQKTETKFETIFSLIMSGYEAIFIDGFPSCILLGLQGYAYRSVGEVTTEDNVRGSKEGFVEVLKVNQTLIRRRIKSPNLRFKSLKIGSESKTSISLVYLKGVVSQKLLNNILNEIEDKKDEFPSIILSSGYIRPFLERKNGSFFGGSGITERPDTFCAKIGEGRVGILIDGTPFAVIIPYLFTEHFQAMDDYTYRPYFAFFIRTLKFAAFFISFLLPGVYVAAVTFHPELIPEALLFNIAASEETTPFPIVFEAMLIHILYEIMREAGLRLPKEIGHAVSIVGAIVIGDAAVSAGLASAPMVMVVALTAISAFAVQSLYEQVAVLKFIFILVGGGFGLFGITACLAMVILNICSVNNFGLPYSSPLSPFSLKAMRDTILRADWAVLAKNKMKIQSLKGSEVSFWKRGRD